MEVAKAAVGAAVGTVKGDEDAPPIPTGWARKPFVVAVRDVAQTGALRPLLRAEVSLERHGTDHLSGVRGPAMLVANHASHLDVGAVLAHAARRLAGADRGRAHLRRVLPRLVEGRCGGAGVQHLPAAGVGAERERSGPLRRRPAVLGAELRLERARLPGGEPDPGRYHPTLPRRRRGPGREAVGPGRADRDPRHVHRAAAGQSLAATAVGRGWRSGTVLRSKRNRPSRPRSTPPGSTGPSPT